MLIVKNITKIYAGKTVIDNFSHQFDKGITHIKGRNGSGKSTLLNIFSGAINPQKGQIHYDSINFYGRDGVSLKKNIGYVPDFSPIYSFLSGK